MNTLMHRLLLSHLKKNIPEPLRMDALRLLYHLSSKRWFTIEEVRSIVKKDTMDTLLSALTEAGLIEEGFTSIRLVDDELFIDFIKSLYKMELSNETHDKMVKTEEQEQEPVKEDFLELSSPSTPHSAPLVIKMLEEVSRVYDIPSEITGRLQISIAEVLNNLPPQGGCTVGFKIENDTFLIRIDIPVEGFLIGESTSLSLIKSIVDDIRTEILPGLTRLILSKRLYKSFQPSLQ